MAQVPAVYLDPALEAHLTQSGLSAPFTSVPWSVRRLGRWLMHFALTRALSPRVAPELVVGALLCSLRLRHCAGPVLLRRLCTSEMMHRAPVW